MDQLKQIALLTQRLVFVLALIPLYVFLPDSVSADTNKKSDRSQGIWKAAVPPGGMKGEFGNHDPVGLATGTKIKVDCSLNWPNPDTGKIYCFNSATSLVYFLDWPRTNIEKARKVWQLMQKNKRNE